MHGLSIAAKMYDFEWPVSKIQAVTYIKLIKHIFALYSLLSFFEIQAVTYIKLIKHIFALYSLLSFSQKFSRSLHSLDCV